MDELISKKTAIEAINIWLYCDKDERMPADVIKALPAVQPETATVTIGRTRGETTMWYECDACGEPVDLNDNYCRNCGRKLIHD